VDYTNATTANVTADAIDDLIEDWHDDATQYTDIYISSVGDVRLPVAWPNYLLIVGDDDTIPFYRYDDPSNDEGIDLFDCDGAPGREHPGWCVDSATNPAIRATDEDYFFTDNPYADLGGGTSWQKGDIELWVGRLLGASAADMLSLLEEGVSWDNGRRGSVVMASVDGWELGLEPDPGGTGHIADLFDVPALFRSKGFAVRNDDIPTAEVRTIDVMSPYEGGDTSWNTNFRNAANNAAGMDLFFIGGHNSYDRASIPGDDFSPDDTPGDYTRFNDDHPIAMIVGCHGGLPVPDIDVPGGVDHDMVYDLIHEGVSAYIGATGFSYGSPGNLHKCTWGERLIQRFFSRLLMPAGDNSMSIGKAMAEAKSSYVFGFGGKDALDRKTVTEFNVYGVPWTFIFYPGGGAGAAASEPEERAFTTLSGPVVRAAEKSIYSRTFEVDIDSYKVATETQDDIKYDLFSIEGGDLAIADGTPILPYVTGYTLTLPFSGTVTEVKVVDAISSSIGTYNIPIAQVKPWSKGGLSYTTATDIDYPYPEDVDLVQYQETSEGLLFTIFPIQHNPTTDETTFYSHFKIQVTYESPLTVVVSKFATDKAQYVPGEKISTTARIENVGDVDASLTATLFIRDALGEVVGRQTAKEFSVPSGSSYVLPLAWSGALSDGAYTVQITLQSEEAIVGGASAGISVLGGEITGLTAPARLRLGEEGMFRVAFANYKGVTVTGQVTLTIQDSEGGLVEELSPQTITVAGGLTETVTFTWTPLGVRDGDYNAIAAVVVDSQVYGPISRAFKVESMGIIEGKVHLQGRANPSGVKVCADSDYCDTTNADGYFTIELPPGTYTAMATIAGYLNAQATNVVVVAGEVTTLPEIILPGGDANGDNVIDVSDMATVAANFNLQVPPADEAADISGNGIVDIYDLVKVGIHFGEEGPIPWLAPSPIIEIPTVWWEPEHPGIGEPYSVGAMVTNTSKELEAHDINIAFKEGRWGFWMESWEVDSTRIDSLAPGESKTIYTDDTYTQFGFAQDLVTWEMEQIGIHFGPYGVYNPITGEKYWTKEYERWFCYYRPYIDADVLEEKYIIPIKNKLNRVADFVVSILPGEKRGPSQGGWKAWVEPESLTLEPGQIGSVVLKVQRTAETMECFRAGVLAKNLTAVTQAIVHIDICVRPPTKDIFVHYSAIPTQSDENHLANLIGADKVSYRSKYAGVICARGVSTDLFSNIKDLPGVVTVSVQPTFKTWLDVSARAITARSSALYSPDTAEDLGYTGDGVNIAIIDTGVDDNHASLNGKFVAGFNAVTNQEENPDDNRTGVWHGTHCAGIAMGTGGGTDMVGVAPGAGLIDVKVFPAVGLARGDDVIQGMEWCIENKDEYGIKILSMSLGNSKNCDGSHDTDFWGNPIECAICSAANTCVDNGLVVVVAGGNDGPDNEGFGCPAAADKVITVAAMNDEGTIDRADDHITDFSNRGPRKDDGDADTENEKKPEISAPGYEINSAKGAVGDPDNNYQQMSGTSMACPHIAGVVALMLEANPNLTPAQVKQILINTAEDRGAAGWDNLYGYGYVHAFEAVSQAAVPGMAEIEIELNPDITPVDITEEKAIDIALNRLPVDPSKVSPVKGVSKEIERIRLLQDNLRCYTRWEAIRADNIVIWIDAQSGEVTHYGYIGEYEAGDITQKDAATLGTAYAASFGDIPAQAALQPIRKEPVVINTALKRTAEGELEIITAQKEAYFVTYVRTIDGIPSDSHISVWVDPAGNLVRYHKDWTLEMPEAIQPKIAPEEAVKIARELMGGEFRDSSLMIKRPNYAFSGKGVRYGIGQGILCWVVETSLGSVWVDAIKGKPVGGDLYLFDTYAACDLHGMGGWWDPSRSAAINSMNAAYDRLAHWQQRPNDDRIKAEDHSISANIRQLQTGATRIYYCMSHASSSTYGKTVNSHIDSLRAASNYGSAQYKGAATGSLVFINGCQSGRDTPISDLWEVFCVEQGALVYMGWEHDVGLAAADFSTNFYERLNDANVDVSEAIDYAMNNTWFWTFHNYTIHCYSRRDWDPAFGHDKGFIYDEFSDFIRSGQDDVARNWTGGSHRLTFDLAGQSGFNDNGAVFWFSADKNLQDITVQIDFYTGENFDQLTWSTAEYTVGHYNPLDPAWGVPQLERPLLLYVDDSKVNQGRIRAVVDITSNAAAINSYSWELLALDEGTPWWDILPLTAIPPDAPTISSPSHPNQNLWYSNNDPQFRWAIPADESEIAGYSYVLDRAAATNPDTIIDTSGNSASFTNKPDGVWYFHVRARDDAGNWGPPGHYTVRVDTTAPPAPVISSSTHPDESVWYADNAPSFTWTTPSDPSGIAGYSYVLDQAAATNPDTIVDTSGNSASFTNKPDGVWYFHVRARDDAGNWGPPGHYTVRVDTTAPTLQITSPLDGSTVSGAVTIAVAASDDPTAASSGVSRVEFFIGGALKDTDITSPWSWSWNTIAYINGPHALAVRAYDAAGNHAEDQITVTVNNIFYSLTVSTDPAGIPLLQGVSGSYLSGTSVVLEAESYLAHDWYAFSHWEVNGSSVSGNPITVTMDADKTAIAYYAAETMPTITALPSPTTEQLNEVAWRPGGDYALIVGDSGTVLKYDGAFFTALVSGTDRHLRGVAWKPDGSYALIVGGIHVGIASYDYGIVLKYDAATGNISTIHSANTQLYDVAWKPDGSEALIVGDTWTAIRYDGTAFTHLTPESKPTHYRAVDWKPDGSKALIVGLNGIVAKYEAGGLTGLTGAPGDWWDIAWNPAGTYALIAGADGHMLKYVDTYPYLSQLEGAVSPTFNDLRGVAYHDMGFALFVGEGGVVWRYEEGANTLGYRSRTVRSNTNQALYGVAGYTVRGTYRITFHALIVGQAGTVLEYIHEISLPAGPGPGPV